jgi:4-hydroxy-tetrahydrodipicolinate synthase
MARTFLCTVSCFDARGALDLAAQRRVWERAAAANVGLYVAGSSPGEGYALARDEVVMLLRLAVEVAAGRVPVRAMGVEPHSAAQMAEFLRLAATTGVDAAQIYSLDMGHGGRPSDDELESYLRSAIEASELPVVLSSHMYNGYLLPPALVEKLAAEYAQIAGINVTTHEVQYTSELVERLRGRLEICVGGPMHALTALALGADGYLCTEAAFVPELCRALAARWEHGDFAGAHAAYAELIRWMRASAAVKGMSVRRTKAMLALQGIGDAGVREPHAPVTSADLEALSASLARHGLGVQRGEPS